MNDIQANLNALQSMSKLQANLTAVQLSVECLVTVSQTQKGTFKICCHHTTHYIATFLQIELGYNIGLVSHSLYTLKVAKLR